MDGAFLQYALGVLRREGASVHILFSFEYVILASSVLSIAVKYLLFIADSLTEGRWEGKVQQCSAVTAVIDFFLIFTEGGWEGKAQQCSAVTAAIDFFFLLRQRYSGA